MITSGLNFRSMATASLGQLHDPCEAVFTVPLVHVHMHLPQAHQDEDPQVNQIINRSSTPFSGKCLEN